MRARRRSGWLLDVRVDAVIFIMCAHSCAGDDRNARAVAHYGVVVVSTMPDMLVDDTFSSGSRYIGSHICTAARRTAVPLWVVWFYVVTPHEYHVEFVEQHTVSRVLMLHNNVGVCVRGRAHE